MASWDSGKPVAGRGRQRRPPVRTCPVCGGQHCAWAEGTLCRRCNGDEVQEREQGLGAVLREQRAKRRMELG